MPLHAHYGKGTFALVNPRTALDLCRCRQLVGSHAVALETVKLLRQVVAAARWPSFDSLVEHLNNIGKKLQEAQPKGLSKAFLLTFSFSSNRGHRARYWQYRAACDQVSARRIQHRTVKVAPCNGDVDTSDPSAARNTRCPLSKQAAAARHRLALSG
jgi:translation initiation factor 2B subunit (eIF-2B alpha/beta/delta family)